MKKIIVYLSLVTSLVSYLSLSALCIETAHFSDINKYLKPNTLVVLDIDDTLLIPVQTLGSDVWFNSRFQHYLASEPTKEDALDKALGDWEAVRHLTKVKIVEEGTQEVISKLQAQKIPVMALTTQGLALATRTVLQLRSLGIDLRPTAPANEDYYFMNQHGVLFRSGILFTSGTPKGPAIAKLLSLIDFHPDRIVFINDKMTHLKDLETGVLALGIEFIGLRYSYRDNEIKAYRPEIAEIQWKYSTFERILSDAEAEELAGTLCK